VEGGWDQPPAAGGIDYVPGVSPRPVIIEAAINGQTSKTTNPHVPKEPAEIAADALACFAAGAAVIHNHIDLVGASEDETVARYLEGWRPILAARPDALVYPCLLYTSRCV